MITDIHSHFLPGIDDGAKDADTALKMMRMSCEQGVDNLIATPHYYLNIPLDEFCRRRQESLESLGELAGGVPNVYLWAETFYTPQLRYLDNLDRLLLNGRLLLELPFEDVSKSAISDIEYMISSLGVDVVIAHIERCSKYEALLEMNVGIQVNAASVKNLKVRNLIKKGYVDYVASDMHGLDRRPPNLMQALDFVERKYEDAYAHIIRSSNALVGK